jgi:hypothetical protein
MSEVTSLTGLRIGKLILELDRRDPEKVIATARSIRATLAAEGRSLEYLATLVVKWYDIPVDEDSQSWIEVSQKILRAPGLREQERQFVNDMMVRFARGRFEPSERQTAWFVAIYRRCVVNAAVA